jgi:hypothetical protein
MLECKFVYQTENFYDIKEIRLLENKLIGVRETHRLVLTIEPEKWRMGKVLKKV